MLHDVDDVIETINNLMRVRPEEVRKLLTYEVPIRIHGREQYENDTPCPLCHAPICSETSDDWRDKVISVHRLLHYLGVYISPDISEVFGDEEMDRRYSKFLDSMGAGDLEEAEVDTKDLPETYIVEGDPDEEVA